MIGGSRSKVSAGIRKPRTPPGVIVDSSDPNRTAAFSAEFIGLEK